MNDNSQAEGQRDREVRVRGFAERLGVRVKNVKLWDEALTHASWRGDTGTDGPHNEALEFLGDAVLGLVVAEAVYRRRPGGSPGDYTRIRARVISRKTVAAVAREAGLWEVLRVGKSVLTAPERAQETLTGNAMEAVVGAMYLDCGWRAARSAVLRLFGEEIARAIAIPEGRDAKSALNEQCQLRGWGTPVYRVLEEIGPPHARTYRVAVLLRDEEAGTGTGRSRKAAEQEAAAMALERLSGAPNKDKGNGHTPGRETGA